MSSDAPPGSGKERLRRPVLRALHPPPIQNKALSQASSNSHGSNQRKSTNIPPIRKFSHNVKPRYSHDHNHLRADASDHGRRSRTSSTIAPLRKPVQYENTYKMMPDKKFSTAQVEEIIKGVFDEYLTHIKYHGESMGHVARRLSDIIRERVKDKKFERFKIISWVTICEKKSNDIEIASRGLWDASTDGFASYRLETETFYAIGNVYAVYHE